MFGVSNVEDSNSSGSLLRFQGPYRSIKRRFYENEPQRPALDVSRLYVDQNIGITCS